MNNQEVTLLTPGPTPIHPRALAAFYWPMRSHMDPDIFAYNDQIVLNLHKLYKTAPGAFTSLLSGTGSLGMEVGFANLLEPNDKVLIVSNGVFGNRMIEMCKRLGVEVIAVDFPASQPIDVKRVRQVAHQTLPKVMAIVHGETSTGVLNPVPEVAQIAAEVDALYSVDAVTTVGMLEFDMAAWGIDYAYTGSQKCLSAPPGLAPVAFSQRAMETVAARKTPVMTWYSDAVGMQAYWQPGERKYHHTVPIHLHWATGEAIKLTLEEGILKRTRRVKQVGGAALRALETAGFSAFIPEAYRLPTVMAIKLPEGLDDAKVRHQLRHDYFISVTGGLGETAGKIWRLGLMGENARAEHYARLMEALAIILDQPQLPHVFDEALAVA
jgi:alanine-glyoxylate transaminase / serine-glyoxylate transaminase / serine-pyruvate transaminase